MNGFGSSPRVRGTGPRGLNATSYGRFIPACAGNRCETGGPVIGIPVHPRVCGEQLSRVRGWCRIAGSSPRVRGTDLVVGQLAIFPRFIPACAGNRQLTCRIHHPPPVHPRVCGEQGNVIDGNIDIDGSSPRVRGTAVPVSPVTPPARFIPACAGNSVGRLILLRKDPVHPRVCGEQDVRCRARSRQNGSSPRVRGTVGRLP